MFFEMSVTGLKWCIVESKRLLVDIVKFYEFYLNRDGHEKN